MTFISLFIPVSHYTNALMYTMICGCFMAPLSGLVYDFNKRFFCG